MQDKTGKVNSNNVPLTGNFTKFSKDNVLIGNIRPYLRKIWHSDCEGGTNGDVLVIENTLNECVNSRYLFHILASETFFNYDINNCKGAKMPRGNKEAIMNYEFTIPNLETQEKIVNILDKFENLTHSLTEGLPAEIEGRKKEYEFYRDELLRF